jgi:hypothetical protein
MKGQQRQHLGQLNLPLPDKSLDEQRNLDPEICKEVAKLLGLLLGACAASTAKMEGASDEQDQR